jgi:hypothetical protein
MILPALSQGFDSPLSLFFSSGFFHTKVLAEERWNLESVLCSKQSKLSCPLLNQTVLTALFLINRKEQPFRKSYFHVSIKRFVGEDSIETPLIGACAHYKKLKSCNRGSVRSGVTNNIAPRDEQLDNFALNPASHHCRISTPFSAA